MDRLLLIRHAEAAKDDSPNPALSPIGRKQAERLAEFLMGFEADVLLHGPRLRTHETARIIARQLSLSSAPSELLEDRTPYPSNDRVRDYTPWQRDYLRTVPEDERDVNGEVITESWNRLNDSMQAGTVIAVTHAFVVSSFVSHVLGAAPNAWMRLHIANASITELHVRPSGEWAIDGVNSTIHLKSSLMPAATE
ncbi:histidine phosphatase family protein [Arthrobacter sp. NPDC090010]|uniref:histidine phosphatase family protein n=1 Tax=Arthrobacter sp. NPDC090010 TaxID=3363942 RepID=UPI00380D68FD